MKGLHSLWLTGLVGITALSGCIKNDIPYPRIQAGFADFQVEHSLQASSVDSIEKTITVFLTEEGNPREVKVTDFVLTPAGAYWEDSLLFMNGVNLERPYVTQVSLYQDYSWTISCVREVERYFSVEGQIGAATIDVPARRVIVFLPDYADLRNLKVTSCKLEGTTARYMPSIEGNVISLAQPFVVDVTEFGRSEEWTIYAQVSESTVTLTQIDAWTCVAWLYADAMEDKDNRFEYRRMDAFGNPAEEWQEVPAEWVTANGGALTARLTGLTPLTTYEARVLSDAEVSNVETFTTEDVYSIPNGSMDDWWLDGKVWCPWIEGGEPYWGTGNKGATTLGTSNSFPTDETSSGSGQAARLETRFVGIGAIGKIAAGNIFIGEYVRTDGTNGVLALGRPFELHPTALTGYFKYKTAPISHASAGMEHMKGQPDTCVVWCALIDQDMPLEIRTNPANRQLFDPKADYVVAYGSIEYGYDIDNYQPFRVELKYNSTSRKPRYLLLTASASKYGDYFTGGNGAVMCVDDFKLEFDY